MTKRRAPLSIDAALARVAGQVVGGWAGMGELTARKERTVRNWGDPDSPESIPMDAAIALDLAFIAQGGEGSPIYEAYTNLLQAAANDRFAQPLALGRHLPEVIKECSEAEIAIAIAARPGATDRDRTEALREVGEAYVKLGTVHHLLSHGDPERQPP